MYMQATGGCQGGLGSVGVQLQISMGGMPVTSGRIRVINPSVVDLANIRIRAA
jgi:hypothetical protein